MALLLVLYTLQGIPMGLSASIPLILKERGGTYAALSAFSMVSLPFSLKIMWAPFVDSCYIKSMGRRKTWLIPVQLLTAAVMILGAPHVWSWLGGDVRETHGVDRSGHTDYLTLYFLLLYFLMATQDIAVDGWALTMLSRENVAYASTCNSIGQALGEVLANQVFITLSDAPWCHRHLGMARGKTLLTLETFMSASGWVFVVITVLLWVFKTERPIDPEDEPDGLVETYKHVASMFRLKSIQQMTFILITCKIAFGPADAVAMMKMQEYGMPKTDLSVVSPFKVVVSLVLPALLSPIVTARPLDVFMVGVPLKLLTSALLWVIVQHTQTAYEGGREPDAVYFISLIAVMVMHAVAGTLIFTSLMSFFNKVSDPGIGGTYMTLLNTVSNLGSIWPNTVALMFKPILTVASCYSTASALAVEVADSSNNSSLGDISGSIGGGVRGSGVAGSLLSISCASDGGVACGAAGGECHTYLDGYTVQTVACLAFGIIWVVFLRDMVSKVQALPFNDWMVTKSRKG